ncbi:TauD/TfdA family dioxygenase [Colwelliaceae bacterium BS250]
MNALSKAKTFESIFDINDIKYQLADKGWVLLRGYPVDIEIFSDLLQQLCSHLTFDPARQSVTEANPKIDAGTCPVGLHIENGNTPLPPDIVGLYSGKSAILGSQTTLCDGVALWQSMPEKLQALFSQPITVRRTLPSHIWKRYVANAPAITDVNTVSEFDLEVFLGAAPGHKGQLNSDGDLDYQLTINPVTSDNLSEQKAFANAILGPSFNYENPTYTFADGSAVTDDLISQLTLLAEQVTGDLKWQDGDVVIIDNKRVMHGRRRIIGPISERKLFIGMGNMDEDSI